jgi:diguanylate cyclase (GGDEF)-like protein/PAS domain S-box-containing protein
MDKIILLVEDNPDDAKLVVRMLNGAGFNVQHERVQSAVGMTAALNRQAWDAVISDFNMPGFSGLDALKILRSTDQDIPFILISGAVGEEIAVNALKAGASDYILKTNLSRLGSVLERELAEAAIRRANRSAEFELRQLRLAMDMSSDSIYLIDSRAMRFVYVNDTACRRLGYARDQLLQMGPQDVFAKDYGQLIHEYDQVIAAGDKGMSSERAFLRSDGSQGWVEISRRAMPAESGSLIVTIGRDITERKQADDRIRGLNRIHTILSGINSAIVRIRSREELLSEACRITVEHGGFRMAWIGLADRAAGEVRVAAHSGFEPDTPGDFTVPLREGADANSSTAYRAMLQKKPVFCNDIAAEPPRSPIRALALKRGLRSVVSLPLVIAGESIGVMFLFASEANFFTAEELDLLRELADNIAFALDHISKEERLNYLAMYDQLTGMANRTLFLERFNQFIKAASPTGNKVALVLIDIERLMAINECLGRQAGDAVIKELSERFAREAGKTGVARVGADHFTIVLQAIKGKSEVMRKIERLWQRCLAEPFSVSGAQLRIAAKAGVALFPNDGADAELLLRNAEAALVKAKELGEQYVFYTSALTARTGERLTLESRLRQALEKDEFVIYYQPKVELEMRSIVGVEALIRWQSPELGLVPPMKFIPLMEETGLIVDVGAWALHKAIGDHLRWVSLGMSAPRVAVNVSAMQLRRRDFVSMVEDALTRGATPPGVDLEITESLVMDHIDSNMQKLKDIRGLGLGIAIDDFGTGYSSLGYLARLPVQTLKIDRSFVISMLKDPDMMTLVQTIISLAHSLRLKVVAEGVEEEEQAKILVLMRCDEMQGYLFSRPMPFDQMTALLTHGIIATNSEPPTMPIQRVRL